MIAPSINCRKKGFAFTFSALVLAIIMISTFFVIASISGPISSVDQAKDQTACNQIYLSSFIGAAAAASENSTNPLGSAQQYMNESMTVLASDPNLGSINPDFDWAIVNVEIGSSASGSFLELNGTSSSLLCDLQVLSMNESPSTGGLVYMVSFSYTVSFDGSPLMESPSVYIGGLKADVSPESGANGTYLTSFSTPGNTPSVHFSAVDSNGIVLQFELPL